MALDAARQNALIAELVRHVERAQAADGLFHHVRWRAGHEAEIEGSPFGATFVAHALRRLAPALSPEPQAVAQEVLGRVVLGLGRVADDDGRVRFGGRGAEIRPDVDDTACVWSALVDAGETCPARVLDAIERAAMPDGGFANDFETAAPAAVELASSTMALAILARCGRNAPRAVQFVNAKVGEIEAGTVPFGFFFPSRLYAAFCVVRAAVDFDVRALAPAAARLGAWAQRTVCLEAPFLERTWALWVLEATDADRRLRDALRETFVRDGCLIPRSEVWFHADPRAFERLGVEHYGCPAMTAAVLLDALVLRDQPERRLRQSDEGMHRVANAETTVRVIAERPGLTQLEVATRGTTDLPPIVVEVLPNGPGVRAYRTSGPWAIRYQGPDSRRGAAAVDALLAVGIDPYVSSGADGAEDTLLELGGEVESWAGTAREQPSGSTLRALLPPRSFGDVAVHVRRAQAVAAERGLRIRGIPRCLGGSPGTGVEGLGEPCVACLDQPACDAPAFDWMAARGRQELRPRRSDEPLADLLRFLVRADMARAEILQDVASLRAAVSEPERAELELSFKADGDTLLEGPRVTMYQHAPDIRRVFRAFVQLGGPDAEVMAGRLATLCHGLPVHIGRGYAGPRRATKLYVRTDGHPGGLYREIVAACLPGARLNGLEAAWVHGVGITTTTDKLRVRVYVVTKRDGADDDARADRHALEGWDVSRTTAPVLESRYVHYRASHLSWNDAAALAAFGPVLTERLGDALEAAGRWYARFVGLPADGSARSLYLTIGPRVPRYQDDGP